MTIHELLALTGLTGSDEIPVWDEEASGEPTKKITAQNFAAAIKTLASLLETGDVVNDLTSTATDKPLSAAQGKALNDNITNKNALTSTSHTVTGYYSKQGKVVTVTGTFKATSATSEEVATNLPSPVSGFAFPYINNSTLDRGIIYMDGSTGKIATYLHTGTIAVNNVLAFSFSYVRT